MTNTIDICPVCNKNIQSSILSANALDVINSDTYLYGKCNQCDILVLQNPVEEEKVDYTSSGYYQRANPRGWWLINKIMSLTMSYRLNAVRKCSSKGELKGVRLLDIGCGKGRFLAMAKQEGAQVSGVEPTLRSFEFAKSVLGDDVQNKMMTKDLFPSGSFDVITMWHVFEHIPVPLFMLDACATTLKSGGVLIVAVPNYDGWIAKLGGSLWFNLDPPRHVIHYNPSALVRLLENAGFTIIDVSHSYPELTYFSILQTLLNKLPITDNFLFNFLKKNKSAFPSNRIKYLTDITLTIIGSIILMPIVLVLTPALSLVKSSDCITVSARKNG